jgi:DNA (cytosine-5)-methyltransferase 1
MGRSRSENRIHLKQSFKWDDDGKHIHQVLTVSRKRYVSKITARTSTARDPSVAWVQSFLSGQTIAWPKVHTTLRAVDLFCASGGLTLGLKNAGRAIGAKIEVAMAVDADHDALQVYSANHCPLLASSVDVQTLVSYHVAGRGTSARWGTWPTLSDPQMGHFLAPLDVVVAGPPCQGHSNLNNKTRRKDVRNLLYVTTVAFAIASNARLCIIENVPDVLLDSFGVVDTAKTLFRLSGYATHDAVLSADRFGVPQRRRRHFMVAVRSGAADFSLAGLLSGLETGSLSLRQAISDLALKKGRSIMDTVGTLSPANQKRIEWLFKNDAYELPNKQRPDCHKHGHTYPSVYGRMKWDEPAQTITTGYLCPGRGRFVHPSQRRTITPREAARVQSFPDTFDFCPSTVQASRVLLGKVIGDAVPPLLGRAVCLGGLSLLRHDRCETH